MEIFKVDRSSLGPVLYCKNEDSFWHYFYFFEGKLLPRVTSYCSRLINSHYLGIKEETNDWFWYAFSKISYTVKKECREILKKHCEEVRSALHSKRKSILNGEFKEYIQEFVDEGVYPRNMHLSIYQDSCKLIDILLEFASVSKKYCYWYPIGNLNSSSINIGNSPSISLGDYFNNRLDEYIRNHFFKGESYFINQT